MQGPQTFAEVSQWQECQQQGKWMGTRTCHIQHHIQMVIRCMKPGSRLPIPVSQSSQHSSCHQYPHQHGCCIHIRWTCHMHLQQNKTLMDTTPSADVLSPQQQGTTKVNAPPPLTEDFKESLLQMKKTDSFGRHFSKQLLNGKAPHHKVDTFTHINGLLYKHAMGIIQKFLALVIPKSWHFTVLFKVHDKLGHQGIDRT